LDIMVTPHAKSSGMQGVDQWRRRLLVKVQALPTEGKANREVCHLFSELFGVAVTISKGGTSRQKTVFIPLDILEVRARLEALL